MMGLKRCLMAAAIFFAMAMLGVQSRAADKINVLLIDGQHNHKWQETTPAIKTILEKTGRFTVTVVTTPAKTDPKENWDKFRPDFSKCNVVFMNYTGQAWPAEVNAGFEKFVENGGGVAVYHAAVFAFPEWENWNKMIGLGWRKADYGDRISLNDDGTIVRTPKGEGPGAGHGPAHVFEVTVRDPNDPIMKGMPAKWSHVIDELYGGQRGPAQNMHIICSAFSSKEGKGTGTNEPIAWTIPFGKGRIFVSLLGHDVTATTAPDAAALLARGTEWAATGAVTLPAK